MRLRTLVALASLACATGRSSPPPPAPPDAPPPLQLPDGVRPLRYVLDLEVVPGAAGFRGTVAIELELAQPRTSVWMHGRDLRVSEASVQVAGSAPLPATYAQRSGDGVAKVTFPRAVGPGHATLRLAWSAAWNEDLYGLYVAKAGGEPYAATQLEPIGARSVLPCFDDPRFKTPWEVALTVPADLVAVTNGPAVGDEPAGPGLRRVRFAATEPLPTYLLFVGVGPFDVVTPPPLPPNAVRDRPLPIRGLAPRGHGPELAFALEATAAIVPWFETYFGIPFPYAKLDQLALPAFDAGAMENAGAIAYRDSLLLATPATPEEGRRRIASVLAHEVAHHWFGDLVTLPWWTDTWLNESFATFMGQRAAGRWRPAWDIDVLALRDADDVMALDSLASSRAIRQPLRDMADVGGQFDGMSYQKGGAVLATFERLVGEERFRDGVRAYLRAHLHGTGSADAFFAALSSAAGRELAPALGSFTDAPGVPLVSARVACDGGQARLVLSQTRWLPRGSGATAGGRWGVPFCARWESGGRGAASCTLLAEAQGALALGGGCPDWLVPAGGVAYVRWTLAPADLARVKAAGLPRLSPAEKVSLSRNLRAAQQAGGVDWGDAMATIAALAADPDPEVAIEPIGTLRLADDRLVPSSARGAVAAYAGSRYRPVLARLGWDGRAGESPAAKRLRAQSIDLLAFTARDPEVRREAARRGAAFAGLDGSPPRPDAIDADSAEVALAAAVAEQGAAAFDALVARLAALEDPALRPRVLAALERPDDPAGAARAATLWRRPEVRSHERIWVLRGVGQHAAGSAALLAELERDPDAFLAAVPSFPRTFVPLVFAGACDASSAERLRAALEPRVPTHPEIRRTLAQALELIRICAAEREASGAAASAFFGAAASR